MKLLSDDGEGLMVGHHLTEADRLVRGVAYHISPETQALLHLLKAIETRLEYIEDLLFRSETVEP